MTVTTRSLRAAARHESRPYLLVFEQGVSSVVHLPHSGAVVIGRGDGVQVKLRDELVSRTHARVVTVEGDATVTDAGSRHGTRVNGEPLGRAARPLLAGDVVSIGGASLVFHREPRTALIRALLDPAAVRQRMDEEVARAVRYERTVAVITVRFPDDAVDRPRIAAALTDAVRVIDVAGFTGPRELTLVLPEMDAADAAAVAARVTDALARVAPVTTGIATCPDDGCDADALVGAARAAAGDTAAVSSLQFGEHRVVIADPAMLQVYALLERLARSELPILVEGETGTGKELAAAAIHHSSPRADGPLVTINCSALPATLIESELFGHCKGAFTGATRDKPGLFERASGGSLLLDELGELPLDAQAKLLRALESRRILRVGDVTERAVDVRVIAATNRDLQAEIAAGQFRDDLYFRLSAARVVLPPLRDRPRELAILARHLLSQACERAGRSDLSIAVPAAQALHLHAWPGNVRELKNAMDYAAAMAPADAAEIDVWHLPPDVARAAHAEDGDEGADGEAAEAHDLTADRDPDTDGHRIADAGERGGANTDRGTARPGAADADGGAQTPTFRPIGDEIAELERTRMRQALEATGWVKNKAAALISMPLRTFVTKSKRYRLARPED